MFLSLVCFLLRYMAIKLRIFSSCDGACGREVDQERKGKFVLFQVCVTPWLVVLPTYLFFFSILFIFGCAGSLLLQEFFSSCGEWGLL